MSISLKNSLSLKLLAVLSICVAIVMGGVIYLTFSRETKEMLNEMKADSEEIASVIHATIKYTMSIGDGTSMERQLLDLKKKMDNIEVYICDPQSRITFSSEKNTVHKNISSCITDKNAISSLENLFKTEKPADATFEEDTGNHIYHIHMRTVMNESVCHQCHGPERKILGAVVLRKSIDRNYAAILNLRNANILIAFIGIATIIALSHTLMKRLVTSPIGSLAEDIRQLPENISNGAGFSIPNISRKDEIGVLQNSFNHMAVELVEKTREIERTSAELSKANKELEAFAYSVSHDLRAPLRNIDGFSKILLDEFSGTLDVRAQHYLKRVRNGTTRMSMLIDDMLTFSRIGRADLRMQKTNVKDLINNILEYYANEIEARKVSIALEDIPAEINCDPVLMQSLFSNLISNALKFTCNIGKPEIVIGFDKNKEALFLRDNGIGFEMQYHDKIFQVFQRLHLPEEFEGTGIGLAIVKKIMERHNGRVWAESELGSGATFYLQLPDFKEV